MKVRGGCGWVKWCVLYSSRSKMRELLSCRGRGGDLEEGGSEVGWLVARKRRVKAEKPKVDHVEIDMVCGLFT